MKNAANRIAPSKMFNYLLLNSFHVKFKQSKNFSKLKFYFNLKKNQIFKLIFM